jgi:GNAT superfamily N-acetyltransferase
MVTEVDPYDETAFRAWYSALHEGAAADRAAPLIATYDSFVSTMRTPGPNRRRIPVAATAGPDTIGALLLGLPLIENRGTIEVEIDVPPRHRDKGVGTGLWRWAERFAAAEGRSVFQSEVHVPAGETTGTWPGARFAERLGFVSRHVEDHLVLALPADIPATTADGYDIIGWSGPCPEEHLRAYADLNTLMSQDVPSGELTRETVVWDVERVRAGEARLARDYLSVVSLARTPHGRPAGYTLTFVARTDPDNVLQDDTFVVPAHRGRRLAAALKAANLRRLEEHRDGRRWMHTWTAGANPAMQAVNARFGFRAVEQTHEYELSPGA